MLSRRKLRLAVVALFGIFLTAFCVEYLTYVYNAATWPTLRENDNVAAKILFVADPQIQGEKTENIFFGWLFRWDADRYLTKNYHLARAHISPDIVVFLGDIFDEGSTASDPEYRRYFQRFNSIFDLPTNQNPSSIKYVFVPGDNDVGGEHFEPVDTIKVNWFSKTFGDVRSITEHDGRGLNLQILKMNLFIPNEYKNPLKGLEHVINGTKKPDIRLIVSHVSLLGFVTNTVTQVIENFKPDLIFSAHSHKSTLINYVADSSKAVLVYHDFLLPGLTYVSTSDPKIDKEKGKLEKEANKQTILKVDLRQSSKYIREIMVPTCSYRMGTAHMGYGAMYLYSNGTMEYTVLWLPSRFKQLYIYAAVYIIMKIVLTPIILWKICIYVCAKAKEVSMLRRGNIYAKLV